MINVFVKGQDVRVNNQDHKSAISDTGSVCQKHISVLTGAIEFELQNYRENSTKMLYS